MVFMEVMQSFLIFFQNNILITIALVCLLLFLLYWKPRLFLTIFFIVLLLVGILYLISDVTSTGLTHKQKMLQDKGMPWRAHL
jgi:hypothetical protein